MAVLSGAGSNFEVPLTLQAIYGGFNLVLGTLHRRCFCSCKKKPTVAERVDVAKGRITIEYEPIYYSLSERPARTTRASNKTRSVIANNSIIQNFFFIFGLGSSDSGALFHGECIAAIVIPGCVSKRTVVFIS